MPLPGDVDRIVGRRRAQPVAQVDLRRSVAVRRPRPRLAVGAVLGFHRQAGLGIADADDVDPLLLGIQEVDPRLQDLLLDAAIFARCAGSLALLVTTPT